MQIIKSKARKPWLTLSASIVLLILGIVFIVFNDTVIETVLVVSLSLLLFVYGTIRLINCWKTKDFTHGIVSVLLCYSVGFALIGFEYELSSITVLPCLLVGAVSLLLGLLRMLICASCIRNGAKGAVRNGLSAVLCIAFGLFLIIRPIENFSLLSIVAGFYFIFYAITLFLDFIASVSEKDLDEDKTGRRMHFALPNLFTALQPARMIKVINKGREEGNIYGGMLIEQKPNAKFGKVNAEILIHLTTQGLNKFGHVDLAVNDKVYSYGSYDSSQDKFAGFVSQGTFIVVPKIPYLRYCLDYQKKYVIGFGAHLSQKQLNNIQNNIEKMLSDCEPFESLYEKALKNGEETSELKDPASNIVRDVGGKVYTVVKGPFRRYFGINSNCVKAADWLLTDSGIDKLSFNGISTPGGYYSMMENMFRRSNTRIIRKTSYIISDEIDDLDELRELAAMTAAEMNNKSVEDVQEQNETST